MSKLSECEKGYRRWISPTNKPERPRVKMRQVDGLNYYWGDYKKHQIHCSRENETSNWYIWVYAPCGSLAYDGYWRDSAGKTIREAAEEAIRGAMINPSKATPK